MSLTLPDSSLRNVDVMTLTDPDAFMCHVLGTRFDLVPDADDLAVADAEVAYLRPRLRVLQGGAVRPEPYQFPTFDGDAA